MHVFDLTILFHVAMVNKEAYDKGVNVPSNFSRTYCKSGNFCVIFISQIFYFRINSEFLNSRVSVRVFYKVYSDSLLARTLNSRGNQFANISEN